MSNPIKASDLIQNDGGIKKLTDEVKELQEAVNGLKGATIQIQKQNEKANQSTSQGREEIKKTAQQTSKLEKELEKYNTAIDEHNVKIQAAREATRKANQLSKLTAKLKAAEKGSYNALSAQYSINKLRLNQMSDARRNATKEGKKLESQTNAIYQEMKVLQEATGKHVLSVGDYEKGTSKLLSRLEEMPGSLGQAANGVRGLGGQFKKLLANPVVLLIATITAGLTALFSAFKQTERGADFMARATGALQGIMTGLVGLVDSLVTKLIDVFENPKQALKDFGSFLVSQVVNRFKAIQVLTLALAKGFKALWERDLEGVKNAAKEAGQALIQMGTGFDIEQQNNFVNALKETTKYLNFLQIAYKNLADKQLKVTRQNRELQKSVEKLTTKETLLGVQVSDTTLSLKEREKLNKELQKTTELRAKKELQIARSNLKIINNKLSFEKANGKAREALLDQQLTAYQAVAQAERDLVVSTADNLKEQNELKQDFLERELDILIDGFDNQKTINEQKIANEEFSFKERKRILEKTKTLSDDSFNAQIAKITEYTGVVIDSNDLISESDAVVLNEKIQALGLSDIIAGRLLEIVRDRKSANQDLAQSEQDLAKSELKTSESRLKNIKKREEKLKANKQKAYNEELKQFDDRQSLAAELFKQEEATEAERNKKRIQAEIDRLKEILRLNAKYGGDLTDLQKQLFNAQIANLEAAKAKIEKPVNEDIYDLLGINLGDPEKQAISDSVAFAKGQLDQYTQKRVDIANQNVEAENNEVTSSENKLQREIENRNAGHAHSVETAEKELKAAKKQQKEALNEQKKAQRDQAAIDTLAQTSSLITATAKLWASYAGTGVAAPFAAITATATMWGSFIASKIKASQLTKKIYGDGGLDFLGGGSHASGNDTFMYSTGKENVFGEGGEAVATINKTNTRKYRNLLPAIIDNLNKGTFEDVFTAANKNAQQISVTGGSATDTRKMENLLKDIKDGQSSKNIFTDGEGRTVVEQGDTTKIYV